jgi:hypothetical protein
LIGLDCGGKVELEAASISIKRGRADTDGFAVSGDGLAIVIWLGFV